MNKSFYVAIPGNVLDKFSVGGEKSIPVISVISYQLSVINTSG
ncbi:hypothetical protein [Okeania sp. SIO3B5]|nr:hypothetical protein [Okeania sp. SIO3B5]